MIEKVRREVAMESIGEIDEDKEKCHPVEVESRLAIEKDKKVYQKAFQRLRELKGEIEHVKRLMEKGRVKLQKDFEVWYEQTCNYSENNPGIDSQTQHIQSEQIGHLHTANNMIAKISKSKSLPPNVETNDQSTFKLPPGARLTGNKETDDDIIAFYKAKEALCARNNSRGKNVK
jgi:hypothetical protein